MKFRILRILTGFLLLCIAAAVASPAYSQASPIPVRTLMATYIGGSGDEYISEIQTDEAGNTILLGQTTSRDFPLVNPIQSEFTLQSTTFLMKIEPSGRIVFSTFIGSFTAEDSLGSMQLDRDGNIYLTGVTASKKFPLLRAFHSNLVGNSDYVVMKLDGAGQLVYSTLLGGEPRVEDEKRTFHVDADGNALFVMFSKYGDFATTPKARQRWFNPLGAAYFVKLDPTGKALMASYFGTNSGSNRLSHVLVHPSGEFTLAGTTTGRKFPTVRPILPKPKGAANAFLSRFDAQGKLIFSSLFGGRESENFWTVGGGDDGVYSVSGFTGSIDFPVVNAAQPTMRGTSDAFVGKIDSSGHIRFLTYFGNEDSTSDAVATLFEPSGALMVAGGTRSPNFPVSNALQPRLSGPTDLAFARFAPDGSLSYSTYLGGRGDEVGFGQLRSLGFDAEGNAVFIASTTSDDFPVVSAAQPLHGGREDIIVFKLNPAGSLVFATYLGGESMENVLKAQLTPNGEIVLFGWTMSTMYPTVAPFQAISRGIQSYVLTKLRANGEIVYSTFLGSSGFNTDSIGNLHVDGDGRVFVLTTTGGADYPVAGGGRPGTDYRVEPVLSIFDPNGIALYSSYLGGSTAGGGSITVDRFGSMFVTMSCERTDERLENPVQPAHGGQHDIYLMKFPASTAAEIGAAK